MILGTDLCLGRGECFLEPVERGYQRLGASTIVKDTSSVVMYVVGLFESFEDC